MGRLGLGGISGFKALFEGFCGIWGLGFGAYGI